MNGDVERIEHSTLLTLCCEVEPRLGLADTRCPECGQFDPKTIKRVTNEYVVNDNGV